MAEGSWNDVKRNISHEKAILIADFLNIWPFEDQEYIQTSCNTTNRVFWYYGLCLEIIRSYIASCSFIPVGSKLNNTGHSQRLVEIVQQFQPRSRKKEIEHIQKLYEIFQHVYPENANTKSLHPIRTCCAVLHTLTLHFDEGTNCKYTYHNFYILVDWVLGYFYGLKMFKSQTNRGCSVCTDLAKLSIFI